MAKKVRAAVIGLSMGRYHAQGYADAPGCELIAVCDIDRARLDRVQREFAVKYAFTDWQELLAVEEIDVVSVVLPNRLHHPVTLAAFDAGKHVLCEKPLAMNAQEATEMVDAGTRAGRFLMVHFNQRFTPDAMWLKRYIDQGGLGEIYFAKTGWLRRRGVPGIGSWFTMMSESGGGALIDIGVHALDLALWYMGYPRSIAVLGATYAKFGPAMGKRAKKTFDVDDMGVGLVKFDNGASLFLEASWASNTEREIVYTELLGTRAGARRCNGITVYGEEAGAVLDVRPSHFTEPTESPQAHLVRSIQRGTPPIATGEQGLEVMRILDALYESAGGRVIPA